VITNRTGDNLVLQVKQSLKANWKAAWTSIQSWAILAWGSLDCTCMVLMEGGCESAHCPYSLSQKSCIQAIPFYKIWLQTTSEFQGWPRDLTLNGGITGRNCPSHSHYLFGFQQRESSS